MHQRSIRYEKKPKTTMHQSTVQYDTIKDTNTKHKTQSTTSNVIRNDKKIANLDSDVF